MGESVSGWGILGDQILGPVILLNTLTDEVYHHFLINGVPVLLEHVPLHQHQHMWFMHDGAQTHCLTAPELDFR
jgi:hypothetical protein